MREQVKGFPIVECYTRRRNGANMTLSMPAIHAAPITVAITVATEVAIAVAHSLSSQSPMAEYMAELTRTRSRMRRAAE